MVLMLQSRFSKALAAFLLMILTSTMAQDVNEGGLYPPIQLQTNLAARQPVTSTSTCALGARCNATCPHGQNLPISIDLFRIGTPSGGVVSVCVCVCAN